MTPEEWGLAVLMAPDHASELECIRNAMAQAHAEGRAEGAKGRNDLRSKLEGMARSRDKWQAKYESFTQAAGMKPLRVAYLALVEAVRSALHTLQDPMRGFSRRCGSDLPHDHKDLQTVRSAMSLLNAAHDAAVEVIQPRALAGPSAGQPSGDAEACSCGKPASAKWSHAGDCPKFRRAPPGEVK